jgi:UDP-glucose 4-epimerase
LVSALSHAGHSVQPFSFTHLVEGKSNGPIPPADVCIHLGARVHVMRDANADPLAEYRKVNTSGTLTLARQAAMAGIRRFLFISSIKVNGEMTAPGKPFSVDDTPAPVDPYGVSKMEAEIGLKRIAEETGMEAVVIRPPLVYGPGVKANFEVMMRWLQRGLPLPFGAIRNRRSLVALDNLLNLIGVCLHHPAAANRTFLVSDGEDLSMPQLLRLMGDALGKPARLIPVPEQVLQTGARLLGRPDLAQRLCCSLQVDIASTRRLLEWNPPVSVDEGIRRTAQHWIAAANC